MPVPLTYPGVYIEELKSGVRTITGVSTAVTAFVGRARMGPVAEPVLIHSFTDYERTFGGLWDKSPMSFAVSQYFLNGGRDALIVRVYKTGTSGLTATKFAFSAPPGTLVLAASSPGVWANTLFVELDTKTKDSSKYFNLIVYSGNPTGTPPGVVLETLRNLSIVPTDAAFVGKVLEQQSDYLRVQIVPPVIPSAGIISPIGADLGDDGNELIPNEIFGTSSPTATPPRTGVNALDTADIFNILCLPPASPTLDIDATTYANAAKYCETHRAMLVVDAPPLKPAAVATTVKGMNLASKNAAIFYPRVKFANPLKDNLIEEFVPCGAVAGIFARTDSERGVWKAPAGTEATIGGVQGLTVALTDPENGDLNQVGINCLRTFPIVGTVVWGSRTMRGADSLADEWKYIPVRRTALYLEESLFRGLKWVVFEPNDEPLWSQIRLNVGSFMHSLFRQGAFQGKTPREAYFVKCDGETTTQADIDRGIVNILVGFAPLKPAEFVVIKIQQIAGQLEV